MAQASLAIGALFGVLGVVLGAFGAHALRARLSPEMLSVWKTANEYHFYHAIALVIVGLLARAVRMPGLDVVATCFIGGVLVFSGSLYAMALTDVRWLGAITPIGGLLFVLGWAWLALSAFRS